MDLIRYVINYKIRKLLRKLIPNNNQSFYIKNIFQNIVKLPNEANFIGRKEKKKIENDEMLTYLENMAKGRLEK